MRRTLAAFAVLAGLLVQTAKSDDIDIGRDIFRFGNPAIARESACRNCHGGDGKGQFLEGTLIPPIDSGQYSDSRRFLQLLATGISSDGSTISRLMPRYSLSLDQAASLQKYLTQLNAEETRGIFSDRIVFGYVSLSVQENDAFLEALQSKFSQLTLYGRRIVVTKFPFDDTTGTKDIQAAIRENPVVAWIGDSALDGVGALPATLKQLGIPRLFPRDPLLGNENADEIRGAFATQTDQLRVIIDQAAIAKSGHVTLLYDHGNAHLAQVAKSQMKKHAAIKWSESLSGRPDTNATIALSAGALAGLEKSLGSACGGTLITAAENLGDILQTGLCQNASITAVDIRPHRNNKARTDASRYGAIIGLSLTNALAKAGRNLTRTTLMRAVSGLQLKSPDWPILDYGKYRLNGTSEVGLIRLSPSENRVTMEAGIFPK
jgi:cytochrome c553